MDQARIQDVRKGEYLRRSETAKKTYVRGSYIRADKAFECYCTDDVNEFIYIKSNKIVFIGFTF